MLETDSHFTQGEVDQIELYLCVPCCDFATYSKFLRTGIFTQQMLSLLIHAKGRYEDRANPELAYPAPAISPAAFPALWASYLRMSRAVDVFERDRWFDSGVQHWLNEDDRGTLVGETDVIAVEVFVAGMRAMITIKDKDSDQQIQLIAMVDEKRRQVKLKCGGMGIQDLYCTEEVGVRLVQQASANWPLLKSGTVYHQGVALC
jgi:hypothetical protein